MIATIGAFLVAGASPASASTTKPILECVFHDPGTGQYTSVWGYNNNSHSNVESIPVGTTNGFTPSPQGRGQPTAFQPGQNDNVFVVTWNGASSLTWSVDSQDAVATTTSTQCATNPVPVFGPQTLLWIVAILVCIGVVLRRRHVSSRASAV
jgi:hypothetical protein